MDKNLNAFWYETSKNLIGIGIIYYFGDWFGISRQYPWAIYVIEAYFVISTVVCGIVVWSEQREKTLDKDFLSKSV